MLELWIIKSAYEIDLWHDSSRTTLNSQKNELFYKVKYPVEKNNFSDLSHSKLSSDITENMMAAY